jgi:hypothetical protein
MKIFNMRKIWIIWNYNKDLRQHLDIYIPTMKNNQYLIMIIIKKRWVLLVRNHLSWKIKTKHHYQSLNIKNPAKNEKKLFNSKLNQIIIFIILKNITNNYKSIYKKQKINYINKIKIITDKYPKHKTSTYFHKIEKLSQI